MAPQLRIRQQSKSRVDRSLVDDKMAEISDSENSVEEDENPTLCKLCSKCFSTPRRLENHKCPVARRLKLENNTDTIYDKKETDPLQIKCKSCSKIFINSTRLRNHQIKCGNKMLLQKRKPKVKLKCISKVQKAKFTCKKCNKKFKFENSFVEHCTQEHSELPNSLPCGQCSARCPTQLALKQHMEKVHKPASFKCPNCNAMFTRNYHVLRHMEQRGCHGGPAAIYQCKICVSSFTRKDNLLHHLRNSHMRHNKRFQCRQCLYGVNNFNKLVKHFMTTHMESSKYECDKCGKSFASRISMSVHLKSHDGKIYSCSVCNYQTHAPNVMNRHMYTHCINKPFKCNYCPSSFVQQSQLRAHLTKHDDNICEICNKNFPTQEEMSAHMKKIHGLNIIIPLKPEVQDSKLDIQSKSNCKDAKFECDICHKWFKNSGNLQKHMLTHTLDKPRRCMYCARARAYVRSDRLIKHLMGAHPDIFKQHLDAVRSQCEDKTNEFMNYKVTQDEIDRILEILDEFQDRMLSHGKVLYGGLTQGPRPDENVPKTENPLMSEDELIENLRKLLMQLIDTSTLEEFGWPDEDVDVVLEKVIEQCGQRPADRDRWSRVQRLRENAKHLFLSVIEDGGIKKMLEMKTIDQVIRHILKVNELDE